MSDQTFSKIFTALILGFILGTAPFPQKAMAQERTDYEAAVEHIKELKEGHIIFILPSQLSKLNELHRMRQSPKASEKSRQRYDEMYREIITERDELHENIRQAFDSIWSFCPYHFIYDFQLRHQPPDTNFAQIKPLPPADLPGQGYRIRMGRTRSTAQFGVEALVVTDPEGNDLQRPFPFYVKLNKRTWFNGLVSIFFPSAYGKKDETDLIATLHRNFVMYYDGNVSKSRP